MPDINQQSINSAETVSKNRLGLDVIRSFYTSSTTCILLGRTEALGKPPLNDTLDSLSIAKACSEHMHRDDQCSQMLGMVVDDASPGYAQLSMLVRDDMVNGHGNCHGGMIFTLADSAFAHACNTRNQVSVAVSCQIEFLVAVKSGERLTATAVEQFLGGRNGVYDVSVNLADGSRVALFRGKSRAMDETLLGSNKKPPS